MQLREGDVNALCLFIYLFILLARNVKKILQMLAKSEQFKNIFVRRICFT